MSKHEPHGEGVIAIFLLGRGPSAQTEAENAWQAVAAGLAPPFEPTSYLLALLNGLASLVEGLGFYAYMADAGTSRLTLKATRTAAGLPQVGPNYAGLVAGQSIEPAVLDMPAPEPDAAPVHWDEGLRPAVQVALGREVVLRATVRESRAQDVRLRATLEAFAQRCRPIVSVLVAYSHSATALETASRRAVTTQRAVEIALDPERILSFVARLGADAMGATAGYLVMRQAEGDDQTIWQAGDTFLDGELAPSQLLAYLGETAAAMWLEPNLPQAVEAAGFRACAAVQGHYGAERSVLLLVSPRPPANASTGRALLGRLSETMSGVVRDRQAAQAATRGYLESLVAVADLVDAANPHAPQHSRQVAALAHDLALALGGEAPWARALAVAGRLHDVGMASIGLELVAQRGTLAEADRQTIRQHPDVGADLLLGLAPRVLPAWVPAAVRHHHERWDGEGYPAGLRGQDIPREARILAAAELFMGYTSARSYRTGMAPARALYEMVRASGSVLDPQVLDALIALCARRGVRPLPPDA